MEQIYNKKAYWGSHTFEASKMEENGKDLLVIEVYRSFLKKYETTFFFENIEELKEASVKGDASGLYHYTGDLNYNHYGRKVEEKMPKAQRMRTVTRRVSVPAIDEFIAAFRYDA